MSSSTTDRSDSTGSTLGPEKRQAIHRSLVSRAKQLWRREKSPDALGFLREHSSLRKNRSLAIELAYEEYCIRRDAGEEINLVEYSEKFPSISRSLFRQLDVDEYARKHPGMLSPTGATNWPSPGEHLLGFVVVDEIGRGAFARAYLCAQPGIGNRQVVVKVSRGGTIEADTMGGLNHPNIMSVYSVEEDPETKTTGICMPFVGRSTLFDVVDVAFAENKLPTRASVILEASRALSRRGDRYHRVTPAIKIRNRSTYVTGVLQLALQLAEALDHAHAHGILHGDLKPSNIVMSTNGVPLIVDFNLSQSSESADFVTGGTLPYMSPEQIRVMLLGAEEEDDGVDERSDIFSFGVIFYELLVGRTPFGNDRQQMEPFLLAGHMLDAQGVDLQSLRKSNPMVDVGVADLVKRCLAFEPKSRPSDMGVVADDIRRFLSKSYRSRRFIGQNRKGLALAGMLTATCVAAGIGWWTNRPPVEYVQFQRGVEAYESGDLHEAIQRFNAVITNDQDSPKAYLARGCTAIQLFELDQFAGWLDVAFRDLVMAQRLSPSDDVLEAQAFCLIRRGDFEVAAPALHRLVNAGSESAAIWNNLGYCHEKSIVKVMKHSVELEKRLLNADEAYARASKLEPKNRVPLYNRAYLQVMRYRMTEGEFVPRAGLAAARDAIALGADDSATFFFAAKLAGIIAEIDSNPNLYEECIDHLEQAFKRGHSIATFQPHSSHPFNLLIEYPRFQRLMSMEQQPSTENMMERILRPAVMRSQFPTSYRNATDET